MDDTATGHELCAAWPRQILYLIDDSKDPVLAIGTVPSVFNLKINVLYMHLQMRD